MRVESWLEQHQAHHSEQGGQVLNRKRESPRQREGPPKGLPLGKERGQHGWNGDRVEAGLERQAGVHGGEAADLIGPGLY